MESLQFVEAALLATLIAVENQMDEVLAELDPSALHPSDAAALFARAAAIERKSGAIKTLTADRAADSAECTRSGVGSREEWIAHQTGTGYGQAKALLETSERLEDLPKLTEALRKGEISGSQLNELGPAATPENEGDLLGATKSEDHRGLKKRCAQAKAKARSDEDEARRAARIHKDRFHRSWTDGDGAYCYEGKTTAAQGARIDAAIAAEADRVFKVAYAEGRRESAGAYRADALVNLLTEGGANIDTTVVIRVDATRLAGGDGICEASTGTIPVDEAIGAILSRAFVKVVLHDGVDVQRVCHPGHAPPAALKTAIFERDGGRCVRPGCSSTHRLETHHYQTDYAKLGPTAYWNLATLCRSDHALVTNGGHLLSGGPGEWRWCEPR